MLTTLETGLLLVSPDAVAARRDEDALWSTTDAVLRTARATAPGPPRHPARKAAAHGVRTESADGAAPGACPEPGADAEGVVPPPRRAVGRWPVDLADPAPHLVAAVGRALASIPHGRVPETGTGGPMPSSGTGMPEQAAVLAEAAEWLDQVWPSMLAELHEGVRQIVLLDGPAIDGFTDFTTHGAVFVNAARLTLAAPVCPVGCGWPTPSSTKAPTPVATPQPSAPRSSYPPPVLGPPS